MLPIVMATGCWMAGKRSLHMDNVLYYQILAGEINMIEGAIERRAENAPRKSDFGFAPAENDSQAQGIRFARYPPLVEDMVAN